MKRQNVYNTSKKTTPNKKTKYTKSTGFKRQNAMNAYQVKQIVKNTLKPEVKYVDSWGPYQPAATQDQWFLLNGVLAGTANWQRVGNSINMKALKFRLNLQPNPVDADYTPSWEYPCNIRVCVVLDRMPGTTVNNTGFIISPKWPELMQSRDANGATATFYNAQPNVPNKTRFKIIRDYLKYFPRRYKDSNGSWQQDAGGPGTGEEADWIIEDYIKLTDTIVEFDPTFPGVGVGMIKKNALYLVVYSDGNNHVSFDRNSRVSYHDN